jgi:hypothetical protein
VQCVSNPISQTHPQCLTSLSGRVQSFRMFDRPGCWGLYSTLRKICLRGRCNPMLRQGDRGATAHRREDGAAAAVNVMVSMPRYGRTMVMRASPVPDTFAHFPVPPVTL